MIDEHSQKCNSYGTNVLIHFRLPSSGLLGRRKTFFFSRSQTGTTKVFTVSTLGQEIKVKMLKQCRWKVCPFQKNRIQSILKDNHLSSGRPWPLVFNTENDLYACMCKWAVHVNEWGTWAAPSRRAGSNHLNLYLQFQWVDRECACLRNGLG